MNRVVLVMLVQEGYTRLFVLKDVRVIRRRGNEEGNTDLMGLILWPREPLGLLGKRGGIMVMIYLFRHVDLTFLKRNRANEYIANNILSLLILEFL